MNSSGLLFTQNPDGSVAIGFEDYDVEIFGGADIEIMYYLDAENFLKLLESLDISPEADIKKELMAVFGENFDTPKFVKHCDDRKIKYENHSWLSDF